MKGLVLSRIPSASDFVKKGQLSGNSLLLGSKQINLEQLVPSKYRKWVCCELSNELVRAEEL